MDRSSDDLIGETQLPRSFLGLVDAHNRTEFEQDVEGALATVCDDPYYTYEPMGWVIRDKDVLRQFYIEAVPMLKKLEPVPDAHPPRFFTGDDGVTMWDTSMRFRFEDGHTVPLNIVAILLRDPATGLIKGEYTFMDTALADIFRAFISPRVQALVERK